MTGTEKKRTQRDLCEFAEAYHAFKVWEDERIGGGGGDMDAVREAISDIEWFLHLQTKHNVDLETPEAISYVLTYFKSILADFEKAEVSHG